MARTNKKLELWNEMRQVGVYRDATGTFGNSTLSVAAAAGATSITVASSTNFVDNDEIRIGSGENMEIHRQSGAPAANVITLRTALAYAHPVGDPAVEQTKVDLGHVSSRGVRLEFAGDTAAVNAATRRLAFGYLIGNMEAMASFELLGFNLENLATVLGIAETAITGSGTAAAPNQLALTFAEMLSQNDLGWFFLGVRKDLSFIEGQLWGVELDPTRFASELTRGQPSGILPVTLRATSGVCLRSYT